MRVISGSAKGRRLKKVPGDTTRPIMDRVKENLFNLVAGSVNGTRWLDLFAGTGQVGIEALSRGAAFVLFVDKVRPAIRTINANLKHTRLSDRATVVQADAFAFMRGFSGEPFDLVYVAPPQYKQLWIQCLELLDGLADTMLQPGATVVVQIDPKEREMVPLGKMSILDERRYGNTLLLFYGYQGKQ
jgi:16S rRNA (guanine(966)-N(2))-methyltransferase RsmD